MSNIINPYSGFIFSLVIFIHNFLINRKIFLKRIKLKSFKYIPISYQKSIVITYLRKKGVKDLFSLFLLNLLYASTICILIESVKLGYRLRYTSDFFLLMTFIQETTFQCWLCNFGNIYYDHAHTLFAMMTAISGLTEILYFKYNTTTILIMAYFLLKIVSRVPIKYIFNKKKYAKLSKKKKSFFQKNYLFLQISALVGINISRILYDRKD